jgi:hypothetical protein
MIIRIGPLRKIIILIFLFSAVSGSLFGFAGLEFFTFGFGLRTY